jgi:uncharacterized protein (TIGR02722 family)
MKKQLLIGLVSVGVLGMAGCSTQVNYGDAQEVETLDVSFGSTDLQTIAAEMTDSMLASPALTMMTKDKRPVMFFERIKNKTSEHIDTESVSDSITTRLIRSGKFRFVDMTRADAVREQLGFQNNSELVDPSKAIAFGQQVGAEYMLYGNLASIVKSNGNKKDVYYKMTMRLLDLSSGLIEWADESEIRKQQEKGTLGW